MKNKKIFPKIKKKLKSFLADESGKITKKDALGLAAGAVLLSGVDEVVAGHSNTWSPELPTTDGWQLIIVWPSTCSHASWIVNGHYSANPTVNTWSSNTYTHSSHGSHGSWSWC